MSWWNFWWRLLRSPTHPNELHILELQKTRGFSDSSHARGYDSSEKPRTCLPLGDKEFQRKGGVIEEKVEYARSVGR